MNRFDVCRVALAVGVSMAGLGCGHALSFDQGRYEVRVAPLTSNAHQHEELKVAGLTLSLDKTEIPYEARGDALNTNRPTEARGDDYTNVMSTVFVRVEGRSLSTAGADANALGQTLAAALTRFGFKCGAPRADAVGELPGVAVECEARRGATDVQKVRARELWEPDGLLLQTVSWTVGSKSAPEAEKFWTSLRVDKSAAGPSGRESAVDVAAVPVGDVLWHTLDSLM